MKIIRVRFYPKQHPEYDKSIYLEYEMEDTKFVPYIYQLIEYNGSRGAYVYIPKKEAKHMINLIDKLYGAL